MGSGTSLATTRRPQMVQPADMSSRYQNVPPTKEGELLKYKNLWSGWETRYFKLERSYLHYYEAKHSPSPKDTVLRSLIVQVKPSGAFPDKELVFEIHHKSGTIWYCQAKSMEEMVEWMSVISKTPIFIDSQQYPLSYPQPPPAGLSGDSSTAVHPSAPPSSVEHGIQVASGEDHHHVLYPCLHHDFQDPSQMIPRYYTPPPSYSEAIGETQ